MGQIDKDNVTYKISILAVLMFWVKVCNTKINLWAECGFSFRLVVDYIDKDNTTDRISNIRSPGFW